jgi:hypothetical protein
MHGEVQVTCMPIGVSARVTYKAAHLPAVIHTHKIHRNLLKFGRRGNQIKARSTFVVQNGGINFKKK